MKKVLFWTGVAVVSVATVGFATAIIANPAGWAAARAAMGFAVRRFGARELTKRGLQLGFCGRIAAAIMGFLGTHYPEVSATIKTIHRAGPYLTRAGIMQYEWHAFVIVAGRFIVDPTKWNIIDVILW